MFWLLSPYDISFSTRIVANLSTNVYRYHARNSQRELRKDCVADHNRDWLIRVLIWADEKEYRDYEPPEWTNVRDGVKEERRDQLDGGEE